MRNDKVEYTLLNAQIIST